MRRQGIIIAVAIGIGCQAGPSGLATAVLTGTVRRGPITPVCQVDVPCDAPFSATFEVKRGSRVVATFVSGIDGTFTVKLPAGELTVVPRADAPLFNPTLQAKPVSLQAGAVTVVDLVFDTGIR